MRHILSLLLENEAGALSRVSGLFSARAFNIESLTVAPTEDPSISRMTLVTGGSEEVMEQIIKQINKLVDVIKVVDLSEARHIERELMLIKTQAKGAAREEVKRLVDIFRGRIIDVTENSYTIELTGPGDKLNAFLEALDRRMILEVVRSGVSGIARGDRAIGI
ncbi:acetolactate synthase-1/3 small subunit [Methylohalomonas lacus]|uniref:Acetolactate synthase small subunit n=1 Tax=Methylohalomonas lacus TaxID=398773 RepID=A0AAE3HMJ4_9GAMM|nr:acetolactate synthase small subunit [Methylohalomonas lacus]MCS3903901.1 acetolactate synthase-1/3 small subunit [Methylohalomonas lacus]